MTDIATRSDQQSPTLADLVAAARELGPLLKQNGAAGDANRRLEESSLQALAKAGLFRLCVPKRYGGFETDTRTVLDVGAAVAEADGGASWVVNLVNVCAWIVGLFPVKAQDEVFGADPNARVVGVLAPSSTATRVAGGFRVTGKWYYNSGGWHATWAALGIPIVNDAGDTVDHGTALIPIADLDREDSWFVVGMRASGSICLIARDVFVPDHRIFSVTRAIEGDYPSEAKGREALYRSAFLPFLALTLIGPQLGLGRAALNLVKEKAGTRPISYTMFEKQSASVAFQLQIAEAALLIDTAHLHAYRAADDIDRAATNHAYPDRLVRSRIRADTSYVAEKITRAIDLLLFAHGAGSFAESNSLQRIWRDSAVAARHAVILPTVGYELYGGALLGVDNNVTQFV